MGSGTAFLRRLAAVLALLTAAAYWPVAKGRVPFPSGIATAFPPWDAAPEKRIEQGRHASLGDLVTQFYPWHVFAASALKRGRLPLWNDRILAGAPFAANAQSAVFDPLNAAYCAMPAPAAWTLLLLLRTVLAGVFAGLLCRRLGASELGSFAGGVAFGFCGFLVAWQGRPQAATGMWLPLLLLAVERLRRSPDRRSIGLAAIAFAMPVLSGHPEVAFQMALMTAAFAADRFLARPPARDVPAARFAGALALAALLAAAVCAAQLLPTFEWIGRIRRGLADTWGTRPLRELLAFFSSDLRWNLNSSGVAVPEGAAYAGLLTLLLAPFALLGRSRRNALPFVLGFAALLQVVYGGEPLSFVFRHLPILRGLPNWRMLLGADLSLAVLAALGLTAIEERPAGGASGLAGRYWGALASAGVVAALGVALTFRAFAFYSRGSSLRSSPRGTALFLLAGAALIAAALARSIPGRTFGVLAVGLLAADVATAAYGYLPFVSPSTIFPEAPVFRFLRERTRGGERVAAIDDAYGPNFEMMYGLSTASGYDFPLRATERALGPYSGRPGTITFSSEKIAADGGALLDLLGVRYLVVANRDFSFESRFPDRGRFPVVYRDRGVRVFENRGALAPAFFVPAAGVEAIPAEDRLLARLRDPAFRPLESVLLSRPRGRIAAGGEGTPAPPVPRRGFGVPVSRSAGLVDLQLRAPAAGVLVVGQAWYPGWRAAVDGRDEETFPADGVLTGILLEPGAHLVRMRFRPASEEAGLALSALAIAAAAVLAAFPARSLQSHL